VFQCQVLPFTDSRLVKRLEEYERAVYEMVKEAKSRL